MDLSIIIVAWNCREYVGTCLSSLAAAAGGLDTETIVVDNLSSDSTVAFIRESYPGIRLIENDQNAGFGRGAQIGLEAARGEFVAVLNPDLWLPPDSLRGLVDVLGEHPRAAWTGPKVLLPGGGVHSGPYRLGTIFEPLRALPGMFRLHAYLSRNKHDRMRRCSKLDGACMVFRASMLREAGGMPTTTFVYGEEQILGTRFRRLGYEAWYDPLTTVHHDLGSASRQKWTSDATVLARQEGHTAAMRESLGPVGFVFYNTLLLLALLERAAGWLVGHGSPPALASQQIRMCLGAFRKLT